jgi:anti-sigma factor RsiW
MHPDTELTAYVTGDLAAEARDRVAAHLETCASCRRSVAESQTVLTALAASMSPSPAIDWGRYRADLRARVQASGRQAWWARPLPATLAAAGVAAAVLVLAVGVSERRPVELAAVEETMLGARLPLLQQYRVVERLDLLEDLDAIRHLDRLGGG